MRTFGAPVAGDPLGLPTRMQQQFTLTTAQPTAPLDDEAQMLVEDALGLPRGTARWGLAPPGGNRALVLHLPWARVVVARSTWRAAAFARSWLAGEHTWLFDTASQAWPRVVADWAAPATSLALPLPEAARAFLNWVSSADARGVGSRPLLPDLTVRGSWPTWREGAVFVRTRAGVEEWQVRMTNADRDWPAQWI